MLSPRPSTVSTRPRSSTAAGPWRSFEAVEFATLEWVDWFNNRRLLEPIGDIPPAEAEERYHAMTEQPAMAA
jgi:putative transposase